MTDQECKFAIIDFGDNEKTGYVIIKGGSEICLNWHKAHVYYYPDDITNEEAQQEVEDLIEHYDNVAINVPLLEHLKIDLRPVVRRSESEAIDI